MKGPLDAISLQIQEVNATAAMGCKLSKWQAQMLSKFPGDVILAFDNDSAGISGIKHFEKLRKECGMREFYVCFPPKGHKDWNEAHVAGVDLNKYVNQNAKIFDFTYQINNALKQP